MGYVLGKGWLQGCQSFWEEGEYNEFADSFQFKSEWHGDKELKGFEVTLNPWFSATPGQRESTEIGS